MQFTSQDEEVPSPGKQAVVSKQCERKEPCGEGINLDQVKVSGNDSAVPRQDWPSMNVNCDGLSESVNPAFVGGVDPLASIKSQTSKPAQSQVSP